jgi:uncharacterized DUF497 family protein
MPILISYDPAKREWTLRERGLDFLEAADVFDGPTLDEPDDRRDYGELRIITAGYLRRRMVIIGWTQRGDFRHVFSMRKANEREQAKYREGLEELRQRYGEG